MSFRWEELRDLYMRACADSTMAAQEYFKHATASSRWLASQVTEKELMSLDAAVSLAIGDDSFDWDTQAYAIQTVFNKTDQHRCEPEPSGMHGRTKYLRQDGKPSQGIVTWYHPEGKKVWVRDKAAKITDLQINFKMVPPDVTKELLDDHPIFPPHLDYALLFKSIGFYYDLHPKPALEGQVPLAEYYEGKAQGIVDTAISPKSEQNRDRRESLKQWGYKMW